MGAALVLLFVGLGAMAAGVLIGRYYVPDDRQLRRTARHSRAYMRALSHLIARDHDTAIGELRGVVEENVDDVEPYFALGAMFRSRGEHERAIRVHQALAVRERDKRKLRQRAMYELGLDFRAAGMPRRATRAMEEVLLEEPAHEGALRVLAALYEEQARFNEAAGLWQRLGKRRNEDTRQREHHLLVAAAQAALAREDLDSAKQLLKAAQKHDESAHFFAAAAELAAAKGNHRGAIERLKQALVADAALAPHLLPGLIAAEQELVAAEARRRGGRSEPDVVDDLDEPAEPARKQLAARASNGARPDSASLAGAGGQGGSNGAAGATIDGVSPGIAEAAARDAAGATDGADARPASAPLAGAGGQGGSNGAAGAAIDGVSSGVAEAAARDAAGATDGAGGAAVATNGAMVAAIGGGDPEGAAREIAGATDGALAATNGAAMSDASSEFGASSTGFGRAASAGAIGVASAGATAAPSATTSAPSATTTSAPSAGATSAPSATTTANSAPSAPQPPAASGPHVAAIGALVPTTSIGALLPAASRPAEPAKPEGVPLVPTTRPGATVAERVLAVLADLEAQTGPRLELALIRAQLVPPGDLAGQRAIAAELSARFPGALAARVASARLALAGGDASEVRGGLEVLAGDDGALAWTLRGRWQCAHCGHRPGPFSWRCGQCRRWNTLRMETGVEPPPVPPRERRAAPRHPRPDTPVGLLGAAPDDSLPAATLDPGLTEDELARAGTRRSLLGRVGGWFSGVWRRDR